ncbi:hypothetical protein [Streptomyces sp. NRRL S-1824]|uniref:hypothetical protein n=1 Tax=Streptomyces sp. NRRL S-1824 TaxID=1463889 RepID=UPI0004C7391D|nr:hypothetical protein [Streptomyces sp. NRRL S-1824]
MDRTLVRAWAEVAVAQEHSPADRTGSEALLLKGAVTLLLDSRTRWPVEVTHVQPDGRCQAWPPDR